VISKKKIKEIDGVSFLQEAFQRTDPKQCGNFSWWDCHPDMWSDQQRELWDLIAENERLVKQEILRILGVDSGNNAAADEN
jgi:hypothetical protein